MRFYNSSNNKIPFLVLSQEAGLWMAARSRYKVADLESESTVAQVAAKFTVIRISRNSIQEDELTSSLRQQGSERESRSSGWLLFAQVSRHITRNIALY